MFLMIAGVRSTEQSGIIGVKIPFDPNIIFYINTALISGSPSPHARSYL